MPVIDIKERARLAARENDASVEEGPAAQNTREFPSVNAYWETRDMFPGKPQIGAVADAIYGSRKVLLVISSEYLRDGRRAYEIHLAVEKSCRAHRHLADIMMVLLDKEAALRLPAELHTKIEHALEWTPDDQNGQELFWQQLQDALHSDVPRLNI